MGLVGLVSVGSTWLLTYLLHSTVVVGAVWMLVRTGGVRRPTTQDLLWKVALVAALATTSLAVFRPARVTSRRVAVEVHGDAAPSTVAWRSGLPGEPGLLRFQATAVDPSPACREALGRLRPGPGQTTGVNQGVQSGAGAGVLPSACLGESGLSWRDLLLGIWLLGAAGLLVRGYLARRSLGRFLAGASPASPGVHAVARSLMAPSGRTAQVWVSPTLDAPCVLGGRVLLPERCVRDLSLHEMQAVLAHEVAHVVRRDPAWLTLGDVLRRVLWMQPLNRVALDGLRESAELVCDDWAVERTRRPLELASSIARVAEWIHPGRRAPVPALAHLARLAHGEGRVLSGRVRRILTPGALRRAAPRPARLLLAALVVAPTLALPPVPRSAEVFAVFLREEAVEGSLSPSGQAPGHAVVVRVRRGPEAGS